MGDRKVTHTEDFMYDEEKWHDEVDEMIRELEVRMKDHPDSCTCMDCIEWEILATK